MFGKVLFPIVASKEAFQGFDKALDLSKSYKSYLIVLLVVQPDCIDFTAEVSSLSLVEQVCIRTLQAGVAFEVIQREGSSPYLICDVADELNVDVIVMGTRGMNLEKGSDKHVSAVIQLSDCSVLVVP